MKDLTGTTAALARFNSYQQVVILVEVDADAPDAAPTTLRYASRKYTLSGQVYTDALAAQDGISIDWARLQTKGGLAQVSGFRVNFVNLEKLSQNIDPYFLENDEMRCYLVYVTGAETSADRIELARAVIEDYPINIRQFALDGIDGSDKAFRPIPVEVVNLADHPDAPFDAYGKVLPAPLGELDVSPQDSGGLPPRLCPCRCLDIFNQVYTAGKYNTTNGEVFQWHGAAKRYSKCLNVSQSGYRVTVVDATRRLIILPVLKRGTNDVAGWKAAADGNTGAGVAIVNLSNLDVDLGGCPKLGSLTALRVKIYASGGYNYTVKLAGTTKATGAGSGNATIALTAADHETNWNFEQYSVEIDGTGAATINDIQLEVDFNDQGSSESGALDLWQAVTGWKDVAANYRDGGVVYSANACLTNPVDQLQALLRGKPYLSLPVAQVDTTSFTTARAYRTSWKFAHPMDQEVDLAFINEFCFQAGLHLFIDYRGRWKVVARAKDKAPQHAFIWNSPIGIAPRNAQAAPSALEPDFDLSRTPIRDIINEVSLRYNLDRASGGYGGFLAASGHYRVTYTGCTISPSTAKLTKAGGTFITDGVAVGDYIYARTDKDYQVTSVDSEAQLGIAAISGAINAGTGLTVYMGPTLSGPMFRSQVRYKTENALGKLQRGAQGEAGYASDFIYDSTTAGAFIQYLVDFRSQRRLLAEFATYLNAIDVELGAVIRLDEPSLPDSRRPLELSTLNGAHTSGVTTLTLPTPEAYGFRSGDYLLIESEILKATAHPASGTALTVSRGQCNTVAAAHASGKSVSRLMRKWEVIGIKPITDQNRIRLQAQELPKDYQHVGLAVADGYPSYAAATVKQRAAAGWAVLNSGRYLEEDEDSDVSYAGA